MDLNWNLLTDASANLGNALTNAAGQVRQHRETAKDRRALRNYLTQPSVRGQNRGIGPFGNEGGTTPGTLPGQTPGFGDGDPGNRPVRIDPVTRQPVDTEQEAFLQLAERNPQLAFRLRDEQTQRVRQLTTDQQAQLLHAGDLLQDVTDDAGYQRALQAAHMAHIDIAGAPPNYDPNFVQGVRAAAAALRGPGEAYTLGRGDIRYQGSREIARGAAPPDQIIPVTAGGGTYRVHTPWPTTGSQAPGTFTPQPQTAAPTAPPGTIAPYNGRNYRLSPSGQWEDVGPAGTAPAVSSDLQNWRGAGSGPQGFR